MNKPVEIVIEAKYATEDDLNAAGKVVADFFDVSYTASPEGEEFLLRIQITNHAVAGIVLAMLYATKGVSP